MEVYYDGAWTSVDEVDPDAFSAYIDARKDAYVAADKSLRKKLDNAPEDASPQDFMRLKKLRPHMTIRKLFDWQCDQMQLDTIERILYEDYALLHIREGTDDL